MRKKKYKKIIKKTKYNNYKDIIDKFTKIGIIPIDNNKFVDYYLIVNIFKIISNRYLKTIPTKIIKKNIVIDDQYLIPTKYIHFFNDKYCKPFWNDNVQKMADKIFLPTKNNIEKDILQTLRFNKNKWFESKFYLSKNNDDEINFTKKVSSIKKTTNKESSYKKSTKKDLSINESIKTRKIAFYPNSIQKRVLTELYGIYRYFYNRTVQYINNMKDKSTFFYINYNDMNSKVQIKNIEENIYSLYTARIYLKQHLPQWMKTIKLPSHEIDCAIDEALDNFKTCLTVYKKNNTKFKLKMKTKKDIIQTLNIQKSSFSAKKNSFFVGMKYKDENVFKNIKLKEKIINYNYGDSSISYHRILKKYYLNLSYTSTNKEISSNKVCAIDPGVKNFATVYSDSKICKIGINCKEKIEKICEETDIIKSRMDKKEYILNGVIIIPNANRRRNLQNALHRKLEKLKNLRDELHKQTINYLTKTYSKIIISTFESQKMGLLLDNKTTRVLYCLSHYKFKERLIDKAKERNVLIDIREEYYTSKTCTSCGNINYDLKNEDIYKCKKCPLKIERDFNGARNILLRNIN